MPKSDHKSVGATLQDLTNNNEAEELYFDPKSGVLEVVNEGDDPGDSIPATEMVREGFFI